MQLVSVLEGGQHENHPADPICIIDISKLQLYQNISLVPLFPPAAMMLRPPYFQMFVGCSSHCRFIYCSCLWLIVVKSFLKS